jgi:hypothetical protein
MRKGNFAIATLAMTVALSLAMPLAQNASAQVNPPAPTAGPPAQVQQPQANSVNWPGAGYGVGALLCNVLYVPAKLVYAVTGGLVGGATYAVTAGNMQAANTVWRSSLGGDYVVTPQMLTGEQPINFSGPTQTPPETQPSAANSTPEMNATANSGSVAPITPIPPSNPSGSAMNSPTSARAHPLDRGTGPASSGLPNSSVE